MEDRYDLLYKTAYTQSTNSQIYQLNATKQAYSDLQYKYFALQQQHQRLKAQFTYLCQEATNRIARLDDDAENILKQKTQQIQALYQQIRDLKAINYQLTVQKDRMNKETAMLHSQLGDLERDIRDQSFDQEKVIKILQATKDKLEKTLQDKNCEIGVLKSALANQQHRYLQKDQANRNLQRELSILAEQKTSIQRILQEKIISEDEARDSNYMLKRQVEDLKDLIDRNQFNLQRCQSCFVLRSDNQRLQNQIQTLAVQCLQSKRQAQRRTKNLISDFQQSQCQNRWLRKELDSVKGGIDRIRYNMDYKDKQNILMRSSMKQSIVQRCKNIIDSGYNRL